MSDAEKLAEIKTYFQQQLDESKKKWVARSHEGRMAAATARAANPDSWINMRGMRLFMHEVAHPGNRPFSWGIL